METDAQPKPGLSGQDMTMVGGGRWEGAGA